MNLWDVEKGQRVRLNRDLRTMRAKHRSGDEYLVKGFQGTCVVLSRNSDKEPLITLAEYLELI